MAWRVTLLWIALVTASIMGFGISWGGGSSMRFPRVYSQSSQGQAPAFHPRGSQCAAGWETVHSHSAGRSLAGLWDAAGWDLGLPVPKGQPGPGPWLQHSMLCPPSPAPGTLDSSSPISSKPEAFFSELQEFREAHRAECIHNPHE